MSLINSSMSNVDDFQGELSSLLEIERTSNLQGFKASSSTLNERTPEQKHANAAAKNSSGVSEHAKYKSE